MSPRDIAATALLAIALLGFAIATAGMFVSRNSYNRLHASGVANIATTLCVAAAILVEKSWSQGGIKAVLIALVFLIGAPIVNHAIARATHAKET